VKVSPLLHRFFRTSLLVVLLLSSTLQPAEAEEAKTIAVLPFTVNAANDLSHIQNGITYMLYSRLSWRNHVLVIPKIEIQSHLSKMDATPGKPTTGNQRIKEIADRTRSDYVLTGSITKLAGSFSIDTQVYDIKNKRFMTFFEQSKISDDLIDKVDRIAATINKKVFQRSTVTYTQMELEKQAHINDLKRQNPEHLMNIPEGSQKQEDPGWKIWKYLF
jgi:TolB-like protein